MKNHRGYNFRIEVVVDGKTSKDAWYRLLKIMDRAGFVLKPKNLKRRKGVTKK